MSTIKKITAASLTALLLTVTLILTVSSVHADSELIPPEDIKASNTTYKTIHPEYGTFIDSFSVNGFALIPNKTTVLYKGRPAKFVSQIAKHGDFVKEGDPILEISIEVDNYHIAELELKLQRAKEYMADTEESYISDIQSCERELAKIPEDEAYARKSVMLRIQKMRIELEKARYEQNHSIKKTQEELDKLYADRDVQYITATRDGFIYNVSFYEEGATINTNQPVCVIADIASVLVRASNDHLSYGMAVDIEAGSNKNRMLLPAEVVVSSNALNDTTGSFALMKPDLTDFNYSGSAAFLLNIDRVIFAVKAESAHMDNVLVIPTNAATSKDKDTYVLKYGDDHVIHKRYVTVGMESKDQCWILYGLDETDSLITN